MRVDVHAHYYPTALYDLLDRVTGTSRPRMTRSVPGFSHHVSIEAQLELMDQAGIERMVMSLGNTPPYYADADTALAAAASGSTRSTNSTPRCSVPVRPSGLNASCWGLTGQCFRQTN